MAGEAGGAGSAGAGAGAGEAAGGVAGEAGSEGAAGAGGFVDVPGFDDLIVQSTSMALYDGLAVIGTFDHNFGENSRSPPAMDVIAGGAFTLRWEQRFDRDSFGAYIVLFVDREGDGRCTEDVDPAWADFVNNDAHSNQPVVHDFDPDSTPNFEDGISCAEFDTWFDEDFPGL